MEEWERVWSEKECGKSGHTLHSPRVLISSWSERVLGGLEVWEVWEVWEVCRKGSLGGLPRRLGSLSSYPPLTLSSSYPLILSSSRALLSSALLYPPLWSVPLLSCPLLSLSSPLLSLARYSQLRARPSLQLYSLRQPVGDWLEPKWLRIAYASGDATGASWSRGE